MDENLKEAIKEAWAVCPSGTAVLTTLELFHPDVYSATGEVVRIVKNTEDLMLPLVKGGSLELFKAAPFHASKPAKDGEGVPEINITMENTGRFVSEFIDKAKAYGKPLLVRYNEYLTNDLSEPQFKESLELVLESVTVKDGNVSGRARLLDVNNIPFPNDYYTRERFPSLGD